MEGILEIVRDLAAAEQAQVLEIHGDGIHSPLKVVVDSEAVVGLNLLTRLTKRIRGSRALDEFFPDGYRLEVTSPGVDAPLRLPFQYHKNINRQVRVTLLEDQVEKELTGKLTNVDENGIYLVARKQPESFIPFDRIVNAHAIISFKG